MIRLAHLSDLHATRVRWLRPADFVGQRFLGWLSWRLRRGKTHRAEVLEALLRDLSSIAADQIVVTGDLTNVACEHEFEQLPHLVRVRPRGTEVAALVEFGERVAGRDVYPANR